MTRCLLLDSEASFDIDDSRLQSLPVLRWPQDQQHIAHYAVCYVCVSDATLRDLIKAPPANTTLCLLPNDANPHSRRGFAIAPAALDTLLDDEHCQSVEVDVLLCNGEPVLNKLVIGKAFAFQPGGHSKNAWQRMKTTWLQLKDLRRYCPQSYHVTTEDEQHISFSALGLCCVPHALGSNLSKRVLAENSGKDGRFSTLVVAPDNLFEMIAFLAAEPFSDAVALPDFLGVLRTESLVIQNAGAIDYRHDDDVVSAEELQVTVQAKALTLRVGKDSPLLSLQPRQKDTRKMRCANQSAETRRELNHKPLPWLRHASSEDFKELYFQLRQHASCDVPFIMFMVLSTVLATLGLLANSAPVIIGAMILAPLMAPIISLAMGLLRQDTPLLVQSAKTVAYGAVTAALVASVFAFCIPLTTETSEISARLHPNLLDLLVATVSGVAGAYAHARTQVAKSLAGVAIAVALVPPLAATGIGLAWFKLPVAGGAFLLFTTNLAGIVFAAAATFYALGYSPFHRARKGLIRALVAVLILAVPLSFSFNQLRRHSELARQLETLDTAITLPVRRFTVRSIQSPLVIAVEIASDSVPTQHDVAVLRQAVEQQLQEPVVLEVSWVLISTPE